MDPFAERKVQVVQGQERENVCYNLFSEKKNPLQLIKNIFNNRNVIQSLYSINYQYKNRN